MKDKVAGLVCPKCDQKLVNEFRWFGPSQVVCRNCGTFLKTNLIDWDVLGGREKVLIVLKEILNPSSEGSKWYNYIADLLFFIIMCIISFSLPLILVVTIFTELNILTNKFTAGVFLVLFLVCLFWYPLYNIFRIFRMIKESKEYMQTGVPPYWG